MALNIVEDIVPVSELKKNTSRIFNQIHKTGRPVVITVNGKPDMVMIDVEDFSNKLNTSNLINLIKPALDDIKNGKVRSAKAFLKEFKKNAKI